MLLNNHWLSNADYSYNMAYKKNDNYANTRTQAGGYLLGGTPMLRYMNNYVGNGSMNATSWHTTASASNRFQVSMGSSILHLEPNTSQDIKADADTKLKTTIPAGTRVWIRLQYRVCRMKQDGTFPNTGIYFEAIKNATDFPNNVSLNTWNYLDKIVTLTDSADSITVFNHNDSSDAIPAIVEITNVAIVPIGTHENPNINNARVFIGGGDPEDSALK